LLAVLFSVAHSYVDSRSEKPARGALFTSVQRQMSQDTILIVDALNYIKGFRYQMYCAARELKLRVCTVRYYKLVLLHGFIEQQVYVVATQDMCREWNTKRPEKYAYSSQTYASLLFFSIRHGTSFLLT
jgi:protein KTI12